MHLNGSGSRDWLEVPVRPRHKGGEAVHRLAATELVPALPVGSSPAVGTGEPKGPLFQGGNPPLLPDNGAVRIPQGKDVAPSLSRPRAQDFTLKRERLGFSLLQKALAVNPLVSGHK